MFKRKQPTPTETSSPTTQTEPAPAATETVAAQPPPQEPPAEQPEPAAATEQQEKPAKAPKPPKQKKPKEPKEPKAGGSGWSAARVRTLVGRVVWLVLMLCAIVLALTAFMVALDFNARNGLVKAIYDVADAVDLGVFDPSNPIKTFRTDGSPDLTKITLLNYGLGAVAYLVVGRVLERIIRP